MPTSLICPGRAGQGGSQGNTVRGDPPRGVQTKQKTMDVGGIDGYYGKGKFGNHSKGKDKGTYGKCKDSKGLGQFKGKAGKDKGKYTGKDFKCFGNKGDGQTCKFSGQGKGWTNYQPPYAALTCNHCWELGHKRSHCPHRGQTSSITDDASTEVGAHTTMSAGSRATSTASTAGPSASQLRPSGVGGLQRLPTYFYYIDGDEDAYYLDDEEQLGDEEQLNLTILPSAGVLARIQAITTTSRYNKRCSDLQGGMTDPTDENLDQRWQAA